MYRIFALLFGMFLMCGCSLPRIAIIEDPLTPEEHLKLGMAYEEKGDFEHAIKEYQAAVKQYPVAYFYLGNIYFKENQFDLAEKNYQKAIQKLPDNPRPLNNLAWLYYTQRKNMHEAEELARRALALAPADEKATYRDTLDRILEVIKATAP
ncbi:MAG: tetratricopeptide repeat protein [Desulfobacterales bacterium]|nr:tetratricopeptide repeat protein [Desulfobacterales bacterium]